MNLRVVKRIYEGKHAVGAELSDGSRYTDSQKKMVALIQESCSKSI